MATIPQLIFFHIGWMKRYRGPDHDDGTIGPHKHLQDNRFGHECFNFRPQGGKCYGYVPRGIDISKNLGASRNAEFIDDIVCVWLAKDPERNVRVIVGWYRDARVFRSSDHRAKPSGNRLDRHDIEYLAVAAETDCTLVPVSRRTLKIPTRHEVPGGLGQSTVWYGGNEGIRRQVWEYICSWDERKKRKIRPSPKPRIAKGGRNTDPEQRKRIETIAVNTATEFFSSEEGGGYEVISRERENTGWDLEASHPGFGTLLIEVKGLSGSRVSVELTPNEYKQMSSREKRDNYVLFVVTNCLGGSPLAHDYRFNDGCWSDADGTTLEIQERTGAVCESKDS